MATVRKREWVHNGQKKATWTVYYTDQDGKRRSVAAKSKKDADRRRLEVEMELEAGSHVAKRETVTIKEAVEAWLKDCDRRHQIKAKMTGYTLKGYANYANNHVIPKIGNIKLTDLTGDRIQDFINDRATSLARSSCKQIKLVLMQALRFAVRKKWLKRNPMLDEPVQVPETADTRQVVVPGREDVAKLLKALSIRRPYEQPHARANRIVSFTLGLFAGLRRGEVVGLQWENVDFAAGFIRVRHSYSKIDGLKAPKTKAGIRDIPMSPVLRSVLETHAAGLGRELKGYVIQTRNGGPISPDHVGGYEWRALLTEAGLVDAKGKPKYTLHSLRHANVSMLIEQGLQPIHLKGIIGHSRITTTLDVYAHLLPENDATRRAVEAMGTAFAGTSMLPSLEVRPAPTTPEEWDAAKAEAIQLNAEGVQPKDIAGRLSVSVTSVHNWLNAAGVEYGKAAKAARGKQIAVSR